MKILNIFFASTRIFWMISRLVLGLIFAYCASFLLEEAEFSDYMIAAFFSLLALALLGSLAAGIFKKRVHKSIKIFSGSSLIVFGGLISYSSLSIFGFMDAAIILFLPVWLLSAGLFELFSIRKKRGESARPVPSGTA